MSTFKVTIEKISEVRNHSNADRLDIAQLDGMNFQFVVGRNEFKVGDLCIYFPLDSLLPQELIKKIGLEGKLAGSEKNRIKTVKLRGEISQGIAIKPEKIGEKVVFLESDLGKDLTSFFGVEKYEPEPVSCKAGNLLPLPNGVEAYDIESCDRFPKVLQMLMKMKVLVTEKIEGTNFSVTKDSDKKLVNQRNFTIQEIDNHEHDFWKIARKENLFEKVEILSRRLGVDKLTLRGEYLGPSIQGNIYGFKQNQVMFFDIKIGDFDYLPGKEFVDICQEIGILTVPLLYRGIELEDVLQGMDIRMFSNGESVLAKVLREGVVIRPWEREMQVEQIGRLIIKQRSPEYLAKEK